MCSLGHDSLSHFRPIQQSKEVKGQFHEQSKSFFYIVPPGCCYSKKKKKKSLSHTAAVVTSKVMNWKQCLPLFLLSLPSLTDPIPKIPLLQTKMKLLIFIYLIVYSSITKPPMNIMNIIILSLKEIISSFGSAPGHYRHMVLQLA